MTSLCKCHLTYTTPALGMNAVPPSSLSADMGTYSEEVEEEANKYFAKIYNQPPGNLSIDEVLEMLKTFKDSINKRERVSCA